MDQILELRKIIDDPNQSDATKKQAAELILNMTPEPEPELSLADLAANDAQVLRVLKRHQAYTLAKAKDLAFVLNCCEVIANGELPSTRLAAAEQIAKKQIEQGMARETAQEIIETESWRAYVEIEKLYDQNENN